VLGIILISNNVYTETVLAHSGEDIDAVGFLCKRHVCLREYFLYPAVSLIAVCTLAALAPQNGKPKYSFGKILIGFGRFD
jgi:hypothetical protein